VIVKDFMTQDPQTISPTAKVNEAVEIMAKNNVGSLLVLANGKIRGVLTERDLLTTLVDSGADPETTKVVDVMSSSLAEVSADASLKQAAKVMTAKKSRLVVLAGGKPIGIVTATDIVRAIQMEGIVFDPSETVSRKIVTVTPETKVRDVMAIMRKKRVGSVIVTKGTKPIGIFTERDLVKRVLFPRKSLETPIEDLATRELIIARDDTNGKAVARIMASSRIKRVLLFKAYEPVGVITARDLVEAYAAS
jgi:CBS domain-containing protein